MYLIRLDDACEYMDIEKWTKMENLLDKYSIRPLVGVIPLCEDPKMKGVYPRDLHFWEKEKKWEEKGWTIAMHGYQHLYLSNQGGLNPVNKKSEFAGLSLDDQKKKIRDGVMVLNEHNVRTNVFFAPSHTFDETTLVALKEESDINVISDTVASNIYYKDDFWFVPLQSGHCRKLPVKVATFCYHPNTMREEDFIDLEKFIRDNNERFSDFSSLNYDVRRKRGIYDIFLNKMYFLMRKMRNRNN